MESDDPPHPEETRNIEEDHLVIHETCARLNFHRYLVSFVQDLVTRLAKCATLGSLNSRTLSTF